MPYVPFQPIHPSASGTSTPTRPAHTRGMSSGGGGGYFPTMSAASGSGSPYTSSGSPAPGASGSGSGSSAAAGAGATSGPPITRSRTLYYLSIRDTSGGGGGKKYRRKLNGGGYGEVNSIAEDEREGLMGGSNGEERGKGSVVVDMDGAGLPPKWVDITDEISDIMARARVKISALEKLHAKHVLPGFNDRSREEREIEAQTADITRDLRRLHKLLTAIRPSSAQRNEVVTAQNVQRGLAAKVQDLSAEFRKKQRVYMNKLQGHAVKNKDLLVSSGAITLKGKERMDDLEEDLQASSKQISHATQTDALAAPSSLDSTIQQRDHELTEIAKSISELADLFRDLGNLVVEQGTVLDCVEYNVMETAREVKSAGEELKVATKYQKRAGRRKCICFLLLLVIGLVIVLIYRPRPHPVLPDRPVVAPADRPARPGPALPHSVHRSRTFVRPPSLPTARPPFVQPVQEGSDAAAGWRPRGRRRE